MRVYCWLAGSHGSSIVRGSRARSNYITFAARKTQPLSSALAWLSVLDAGTRQNLLSFCWRRVFSEAGVRSFRAGLGLAEG